MKKILIIYLFQIIALALTGQNIPVPGTAFIGVNIIDPGTKKIIKDQTVYIEQSFIKQFHLVHTNHLTRFLSPILIENKHRK